MTYDLFVAESGWRQALQDHVGLIRYWRSPAGASQGALLLKMWRDLTVIRSALQAGAEPDVGPKFRDMSPEERGRTLLPIAQDMADRLNKATTWAVAADMVVLVAHAASLMPPETIEPSDLPHPNGFVFLEQPMVMHTGGTTVARVDEGVHLIPFRAFHWFSAGETVEVVCYSGRGDYGDEERHLSHEEELELPPLTPSLQTDWRFGDPSWSGDGQPPQAALFLKALWTISFQPLAMVSTEAPIRAAQRRAARIGLPEDGSVRVITLRRIRRPSPDDNQASAVQWTHRWLVAGHWRNQYLPSTGQHRLQWINDYVKGPDDMPLVPKTRVVDVKR